MGRNHTKSYAATERPAEPEEIRVLGVEDTHFRLDGEGDLYVTQYGLPLENCLLPSNLWSDKQGFGRNARRL